MQNVPRLNVSVLWYPKAQDNPTKQANETASGHANHETALKSTDLAPFQKLRGMERNQPANHPGQRFNATLLPHHVVRVMGFLSRSLRVCARLQALRRMRRIRSACRARD